MNNCEKCKYATWDCEEYYGTCQKDWFVDGCEKDCNADNCDCYTEVVE